MAKYPLELPRGRHKVATALIIWVALLALASWRRGALPDQQGAIAMGVATLVIVISAAVAPDFVTYLLLAIILVMVFQNAEQLTQLVDRGGARLRQTLGV